MILSVVIIFSTLLFYVVFGAVVGRLFYEKDLANCTKFDPKRDPHYWCYHVSRASLIGSLWPLTAPAWAAWSITGRLDPSTKEDKRHQQEMRRINNLKQEASEYEDYTRQLERYNGNADELSADMTDYVAMLRTVPPSNHPVHCLCNDCMRLR